MIYYLTIDEVLFIHEIMISLYGGRGDIHDFTMLHSAIERPKATFGGKDLYPTIFEKGAALIQSLILNHPFDDGNKRTAITAAARFFYINGYQLELSLKKSIQFALDIDSQKLSFEEIVSWFKKHAKRLK